MAWEAGSRAHQRRARSCANITDEHDEIVGHADKHSVLLRNGDALYAAILDGFSFDLRPQRGRLGVQLSLRRALESMKPMPAHVVIHNATTERTLCRRAELAVGFASRFLGLLGRRGFETTDGLVLRPSSSVHTIGMQFAIDVIALDKERRVVALRRELKPQRVALLRHGTKEVLELPAGRIEESSVAVGDRLSFEPANPA